MFQANSHRGTIPCSPQALEALDEALEAAKEAIQASPRNSTGIHLVEETYCRHPVIDRTDLLDATEDKVVQGMIEGQYAQPRRIISCDPVEGWAQDVSEKIALAVIKRAWEERRSLPADTVTFCELHVPGWFYSEAA